MAAEQPSSDRSLELDKVVQRFAESETLLNQTAKQLKSLLAAEEKSDARARSLSETARAVEDYSASARLLLDEVKQNVGQAGEILQAGARLLDSPALAELSASVAPLSEQIASARDAQAAAQAVTQREITALRENQSEVQAETQREMEAFRETHSRAQRETKQDFGRLRDLLQRSIQESHAKHARKLWIATVVLLLGQAAAVAVVVAVVLSP